MDVHFGFRGNQDRERKDAVLWAFGALQLADSTEKEYGRLAAEGGARLARGQLGAKIESGYRLCNNLTGGPFA